MEEKHSILYAIHIFEGKFELLCQSKFGIKINVFPRGECGVNQQQEGGSSNSLGTMKNPIDLDIEPSNSVAKKMEGGTYAQIDGQQV